MDKLKKLEKFLESEYKVELKDGSLIVSENKNIDEKMIPANLITFVTVYEKETNIVKKGQGYEITVTKMSANNFSKLLSTVFSTEYTFEMTGEYTIMVTPISSGVRPNGTNESKNECECGKHKDNDDMDDMDEKAKFYRSYTFNKDSDADSIAKKLSSKMLKMYSNEIETSDANTAKDIEDLLATLRIKALISEEKNKVERTFENLALRLDEKFKDIEIELHEDGLKVSYLNPMEVAEQVEELTSTNIDVYENYILIGE